MILLIILILVILIWYCMPKMVPKKTKHGIYQRFQNRFKNNGTKTQLNGIDMVYCIVMPQRKEYINTQIDKLNVECKYFNAITPSDLTKNDYDTLSTINSVRSPIYKKYTRLPVLLSFIMCFMDSLENGYSTIVVFEDDIEIRVDINTLNASIKEFNNSSFDFFYMGYCYLNCAQSPKQMEYIVEVPNKNILCCHSMCIKTQHLQDLVNYCFPMTHNSDEIFRDYYIENLINVCVPKYAYFTQNRSTLVTLNESYDELKTCKF
jgi:hypothetical protein